MSRVIQKLCIGSGPVAFLLFGIGLVLAGFLPPPRPSLPTAGVMELYQQNQLRIQLGAVVMLVSGALFPPFFAIVAAFMRRIEGKVAPLATTQVIAASLTSTLFYLGAMLLAITALRPARMPGELTVLMNDISWIVLVSPGAAASVMTLSFALAILGDGGDAPVLPRWSGYFSLWTAILSIPAQMAVMFLSGPFAWNGLLSFWVGGIAFAVWTNIVAVVMWKRIEA